MTKLNVLAIGAHPDDTELSCAGTLLVHKALGEKVGVVDLTRGELGTRGTVETRKEEAANGAAILGLDIRDNLGLKDGFVSSEESNKMAVVAAVRKYRPDIVLAPAQTDRHPDHGNAGKLVVESCFLAGLKMIETEADGQKQEHWRPGKIYQYIQDRYIEPDFVVDITSHFETKMEAVKAFGTQFFNKNSTEPETYISTLEFIQFLEARNREWGHRMGVKFGEGFTTVQPLGVQSLNKLF